MIIPGKSFGTMIAQIQRIDCSVVPNVKRWTGCEGLPADHIRKCEQTLIRELQRDLSPDERRQLWIQLYLKLQIEQQIELRWTDLKLLKGLLPLTHIVLDDAALILMQKPTFNVEFTIQKLMDMVWEVKCNVSPSFKSDSENSENPENSENQNVIKARIEFKLENTNDQPDTIFTAGQEEVELRIPESFTTAVHCLPVGDLIVIGRFYVNSACFIRRVKFNLKD